MDNGKIGISISASLGSGVQKKLQGELDALAKKLVLTIKNTEIAGVKSTQAGNASTKATESTTRAIKNQVDSIDKLVARYKTMKISYEELDKYGRRIIESERFKTKTLSEQAKVYDKLKVIEKERTRNLAEIDKLNKKIQDSTKTKSTELEDMTKLHGQALEMNRKFNEAKINQQLAMDSVLYKAEKNKFRRLEEEAKNEAKLVNKSIEEQYWAKKKQTKDEFELIEKHLEKTSQRRAKQVEEDIKTENKLTNNITKQSGAGNNLKYEMLYHPEINRRASSAMSSMNVFSEAFKSGKVSTQMKELNQEFVKATQSGYGFNDMLTQGWKKMAVWSLAATAFYAPIRGLQYMITTLKETEDAIVSIARVMDDVTFRAEKFGNSMFEIAKQTGSTFKETADVSLRFAQAGYNVVDTLQLTKTALMAVQTAELSAEKATESLIGIMSQWGMQANEMPLLLDKINKISDEYTVTSEDLVQGLLRSSSAAKNLGIDINQTISLLTVMRETSGRTGKVKIASYVQKCA